MINYTHSITVNAGIIEDAASSLFTYKAGENFSDFYVPDYQPAFETTFLDPVLETRAEELCGGNAFCLYDFAVTGRMDIALSTLKTVQDYEFQAELTMLSKWLLIFLDTTCEFLFHSKTNPCMANQWS